MQKLANGSIDDDLIKNICYNEYANVTAVNPNMKNYEWYTFRKYLVDSSQPCNEMLKFCQFGLEKLDCMTIFDTVLSDEGVWLRFIYSKKKYAN